MTRSGVASFADSRFVIAWVDSSQTGGDHSGHSVKAQLFNSDGTRSGNEFQINRTTAGNQYLESITALADGRFVVAWADDGRSGNDTSGFAIRAQIFDPREAAVNLTGSALGDDFIGTAFDDTMFGKAGDDQLVGKRGSDALFGQIGNDLLVGRLGADTLVGGKGNDTLTGGLGADQFIFAAGGGHDIVTDFQLGRDAVDLSDFGFSGLAAAARHFKSCGADVVFTFWTQTLTIENVTLAQLSSSDLIL